MKTLAIFLLATVVAFGASAQISNHSGTAKSAETQPLDDISGMYSFLQEGEFVQITVEDRTRVSGFISRYGELPSDKGAFLDHFIKKGTLQGTSLTFRSEPVHGVWYEFRGNVEHGIVPRGEEGYWLLKGTLQRHVTDTNQKDTASSREVTFKSFPQDTLPNSSGQD